MYTRVCPGVQGLTRCFCGDGKKQEALLGARQQHSLEQRPDARGKRKERVLIPPGTGCLPAAPPWAPGQRPQSECVWGVVQTHSSVAWLCPLALVGTSFQEKSWPPYPGHCSLCLQLGVPWDSPLGMGEREAPQERPGHFSAPSWPPTWEATLPSLGCRRSVSCRARVCAGAWSPLQGQRQRMNHSHRAWRLSPRREPCLGGAHPAVLMALWPSDPGS